MAKFVPTCLMLYGPPILLLLSYLIAGWHYKRKCFTSDTMKSATRWRRVMWASVGATVYGLLLVTSVYFLEAVGAL